MSFRDQSFILLGVFLVFCLMLAMATQSQDLTERKVKTVYDITGRALHSSENNKGWHYVQGSATLSSGRVTVTLNTSTGEGRQDVSFLADSTYFGTAWALDTTSVYRYRVNPLSGTRFMIISDSSNDNSTVRFLVEGQ